jgi:hypothetical protein
MASPESRRTLGERFQAARMRSFVGRKVERALFRSALEGGEDAFAVLYVHGPGGAGKTSLLRVLAADAREHGRDVVEIDARDADATPLAFEAAVGPAVDADGLVLVIDTFEQGQALESWLRTRFLPRLPHDAVVVVAGRLPPDPAWLTDPDWNDALRVLTLPDLGTADARSLLAARGVPAALHEPVLAFAGGHPLALTLAADLAARHDSSPTDWAPDPSVVKTLLTRLVGTLPSVANRRALEVCAHVEVTTEELLRATIGDRADEMFAWLRELPFVESGRAGVYPHDVVRESLTRDLRWRDPGGFASLHRAVHKHLLAGVRSATGPAVLEATRSLLYLHRHTTALADHLTWAGRGEVYEDTYRPADRPAVLRLTTECEGSDSARIAEFWLRRQPSGFHVHRRADTDEVVAFSAWLRLAEPDPVETGFDPVAAVAWHHAAAAGPVRPGEHIAIHRFTVDPAAYGRVSPAVDLMILRTVAEWLRGEGLAWSYQVIPRAALWDAQMASIDQERLAETVSIGANTLTLYTHDWRAFPAHSWLERQNTEILSGRRPEPLEAPARVVLSRPDFDSAVRTALRDAGNPDRLARNPLCATTLAGSGAELHAALLAAVQRLGDDPRASKPHRAVQTTYFARVPTQEAAAERLGLPFSTYRRHLTTGIERICESLWDEELAGT